MNTITSRTFGAKFRTKRELERLIRRDMDIYLCANKHVNIFFYRALISGEK